MSWNCGYPTDHPGLSGSHPANVPAGQIFSVPCFPLRESVDVYLNQSDRIGSYPAAPDAGRASSSRRDNGEMPSADDADPMFLGYTAGGSYS